MTFYVIDLVQIFYYLRRTDLVHDLLNVSGEYGLYVNNKVGNK